LKRLPFSTVAIIEPDEFAQLSTSPTDEAGATNDGNVKIYRKWWVEFAWNR